MAPPKGGHRPTALPRSTVDVAVRNERTKAYPCEDGGQANLAGLEKSDP